MNKELNFKIKVDGKELDVAKLSVNDFKQVYSETQQKLNSLPIGTQEWKSLNGELNTAEKAFNQTKEIASTTDSKFKSLKVQIRQTTVALQEAEEKGDIKTFNKLKNDLDDLNDKFEITQLKSMKFTDALATLPGVAGFVGQSFQGLDKAFKLLVANPLIATIGALVGLFMALKESLSRTQEGADKLARIGEFLERVLNGIFAVIEPLANLLIDFVLGILESKNAMKVLGQVVGVTAGILSGAFNIIKTLTSFIINNFINAFKAATGVISGFGDVIAGVFTFDFERIKKGVLKVKDTVVEGFNNTVDNVKDTFKGLTEGTVDAFTSAYDEAEKSFSEGFKRQTKRSKELAKDAKETADAIKKAKQDEINANEALQQSEDELAESRRKKDQNRLQELKNQEKFLKDTYEREKQRILDLLKVEGTTEQERKALMIEMNNLNAKYAQDQINLQKQITDAKKEQYDKDLQNYKDNLSSLDKQRQQAFNKETNDLDLKFSNGEMSQLEYNIKQRELNKTQSAERLSNLQNDFKSEKEFQQKKFDEGLIDQETYNKNIEDATRSFNDNQFALQTAFDQASIDQQKFLSETLVQTKQAEIEARIGLENSIIDAASTVGGLLSQLAGDNKALAITGLLVEQGAAIADILVRSARTKADLMAKKAVYMSLIPNPVTAPIGTAGVAATSAGLATNTIGTITSLAAVAAAIASGVSKISSQGKESKSTTPKKESGPRGYAKGGMIGGKRHAEGGTLIEAEAGEAILTRGAVSMFRPLLSMMNQAGGGVPFTNMVTTRFDNPSTQNVRDEQSPPIFKTYVVEQDLTNSQHKQARLKNLSTL